MPLTSVGTGILAGYRHPSVPNLFVRETDPSTADSSGQCQVLTGVILGVPTTDANTYVHGCLLTQTDGTSQLSAQWENVGTAASPAWQRWSVT